METPNDRGIGASVRTGGPDGVAAVVLVVGVVVELVVDGDGMLTVMVGLAVTVVVGALVPVGVEVGNKVVEVGAGEVTIGTVVPRGGRGDVVDEGDTVGGFVRLGSTHSGSR